MTTEEARARGLGAVRGCLMGLALSAPFWCAVAALAAWLARR